MTENVADGPGLDYLCKELSLDWQRTSHNHEDNVNFPQQVVPWPMTSRFMSTN